jgi:hypothetical protein
MVILPECINKPSGIVSVIVILSVLHSNTGTLISYQVVSPIFISSLVVNNLETQSAVTIVIISVSVLE